jgi:hypothetical protein
MQFFFCETSGQVHTTDHWLSGSECFDNLCKLNMF